MKFKSQKYTSEQNEFNFEYFCQEVEYIWYSISLVASIFYNLKLEEEIEFSKTILELLNILKYEILKHEKKIAVFGIFKSGKSTLINAILDQKILPSRTNRATGVITSISYNSQEYANILFDSSEEKRSEIVSINQIKKYILLDTSDVIAKPPDNIKKVEINLPDFFLPKDCYLTDTPGLLDNEDLTQLSYK